MLHFKDCSLLQDADNVSGATDKDAVHSNGTREDETTMKVNKTVGTSGDVSGGKHGELRERWTGRFDFVLSCIGYAVGLGNIWRFPYLCYRNGGAVFLIPYVFFMVICAMPLVLMEFCYGQFASLSPITIWRISPLFKGIGYGMVLISGICCIYYNTIIAWTLYYLFNSFHRVLPWSNCDNSWNTPSCTIRLHDNSTAGNNTGSFPSYGNYSNGMNDSEINRTRTPSEEYWQNHVLQITEGIENIGSVRLELLGCLVLAWVCVFLCLIKGITSSGKVVYVTATFPYVILIILLCRGVSLPGSEEGIKFYLIPQWHKLLSFKVWGEAAMQIFYSMGATWGAMITFASYNKFNNNCYRDAILLTTINACTSMFAGFVIFSIIGFMAWDSGSTIDEVVTQGPGLVFVVYPAAVSRMPLSQLWAVLFFLMIFIVGLDSQFGMLETIISGCVDEFPRYLKKKQLLLTGGLCVAACLLGIPCVTQGGIYYLQIMDWYSSVFSCMIIGFTECMVVAWIYGVNRFLEDIEYMIGFRPSLWFKICWCGITPLAILFVLLFSIISHKPVTYGSYSYPTWAVGVGWFYALCSIVLLPMIAAIDIFRAEGPILQRIKDLAKPSSKWGPAREKDRKGYSSAHNSCRQEDLNMTMQIETIPLQSSVPS